MQNNPRNAGTSHFQKVVIKKDACHFCSTRVERNKHTLFSSARFRRLTLPLLGAELLTWRCSAIKCHGQVPTHGMLDQQQVTALQRDWEHLQQAQQAASFAIPAGASPLGNRRNWELLESCNLHPSTLLSADVLQSFYFLRTS